MINSGGRDHDDRCLAAAREVSISCRSSASVHVWLTIDLHRRKQTGQRATRRDRECERNARRSIPHSEKSVRGIHAHAFISTARPSFFRKTPPKAGDKLRLGGDRMHVKRPFANFDTDRLLRRSSRVQFLELADQKRKIGRRRRFLRWRWRRAFESGETLLNQLFGR